MSVDQTTVRHIAHLARLRLPEERVATLEAELNSILHWVEQLNAVDTEAVPPMTSAVETHLHWRDDVVTEGEAPDTVLANAPAADYGFFAVPKVIE